MNLHLFFALGNIHGPGLQLVASATVTQSLKFGRNNNSLVVYPLEI